jgi:hypothetical protein
MVKSVVVTEFFNLSELKDTSKGTRPREFYMQNGKGTIQLECPMIIFCDADTRPMIQEIREDAADPTKYPTVYIEKNIAEYDHYKLNWELVNENRLRSSYYKDGGRNTTSYFLTTSFKFVALRIAEERNDFDATHYFWIDFGIQHVVKTDVSKLTHLMLENPHPKIGALYIHYRSKEDLNNMEWVCNQGTCGMAGGVFSVEKHLVRTLYTLAMSIFYEQMNKGVGHADEQIFTYCYNRRPDLFTLYYGDYYSLICNYHTVKKDWYTIKECFIKRTVGSCRRDLAVTAARKVLESVEKGDLRLSADDIQFLNSCVEQ